MEICREQMRERRLTENNWFTWPLYHRMRRRWYDDTGSVIRSMLPVSPEVRPTNLTTPRSNKKADMLCTTPGQLCQSPINIRHNATCRQSSELHVTFDITVHLSKKNECIYSDKSWYRKCEWNIIWRSPRLRNEYYCWINERTGVIVG
jgi:hypothetical protein